MANRRHTNQYTAKKSWRGCGNHIPSALSGVPEDRWCTCGPAVMVDGKAYPPAARLEIPGMSWIGRLLGLGGDGAGDGKGGGASRGKGEGEL